MLLGNLDMMSLSSFGFTWTLIYFLWLFKLWYSYVRTNFWAV